MSKLGSYWAYVRYRLVPETLDGKVIFAVLLAVLALIVLLPIGTIFFYAFTEMFPLHGAPTLTLANFNFLNTNPSLLFEIARNTVLYAGFATLLAVAIGGGAAVLLVKYLDNSRLVYFMILPYGIPSIAALNGWVLLFRDGGLVTRIVMNVFHLSHPPWNIYSLAGMIFVEGIHTAPVAFLLILPGLRNVPASLEDASLIAGASRFQTFRRTVLPVIWPSILSAMIFLFARTVATVGTPSVLGLPKQIFTLGSAIPFLFLGGNQLEYGKAFAFSIIFTIGTGLLILYYLRVQSQEGKFATVLGRGEGSAKRYETSRTKRRLAIGSIVLYLIVAGVAPLVAIIWNSLLPAEVLKLTLNPSLFTLENYVRVLSGNVPGITSVVRGLQNTLLVGLTVPTIIMFVALLIAYTNQTLGKRWGALFSLIAAAPLAVPDIARGLGFLSVFITTPLYGTFWILFVAYLGVAIAPAMRYASPSLTRIGAENSEASISSGAGLLHTYRKIILPLVKEDYIAGWMHMFVAVIRNVSVPVLLYSAGSEVLAIQLLFTLQSAYFKAASTLAVLITLLSLIPYMLLQYWRVSGRKERRSATEGFDG